MKLKYILIFSFLFISIVMAVLFFALQDTPFIPSAKTPIVKSPPKDMTLERSIVASYSSSYALLIGESDYTDWQDLKNIPAELNKVQKALIEQGFQVELFLNLDSIQLKKRFQKFTNKHGFKKNSRLVFFYAGHGHTRQGRGYLVPTNAPNPAVDDRGFLQHALKIKEIIALAQRIDSKHVLFVFDSNFFETALQLTEPGTVPKSVSKLSKLPIRQFIIAGSANETLPEESAFTEAFVHALRYGVNKSLYDDYFTGQELGFYLQQTVSQYTEQTSQYGTVQDINLSEGDVIFVFDNTKQTQSFTEEVVLSKKDLDKQGTQQSKLMYLTVKEDRESQKNEKKTQQQEALDAQQKINDAQHLSQKGYRYTDNNDGTVTDNQSGLIWMKNADCFGKKTWKKAAQSVKTLASGECGLRDGSRQGEWRLPYKEEWMAMVEKKHGGSWKSGKIALTNAIGTGKWREGDVFTAVSSAAYWSYSRVADNPDYVWDIYLSNGYINSHYKTFTHHVWAVKSKEQ
ncbi:MAG: DUF1566 domain-containing protein [Thiomargarita sp.]|nr:DUF1566 domain-containing protein [Thiomargarita sp.]